MKCTPRAVPDTKRLSDVIIFKQMSTYKKSEVNLEELIKQIREPLFFMRFLVNYNKNLKLV